MTVDLAKIRKGDKVAVRLRVVAAGGVGGLFVGRDGRDDDFFNVEPSSVVDHFPAIYPLAPGAKVRLGDGPAVGTVIAIYDDECWIRWPNGEKTTGRVPPTLRVIAPAPLRAEIGIGAAVVVRGGDGEIWRVEARNGPLCTLSHPRYSGVIWDASQLALAGQGDPAGSEALHLCDGGVYRSRGGSRVGPVIADVAKSGRFHTRQDGWFEPNGKFSGHSAEHDLDLVAEWTDEAPR